MKADVAAQLAILRPTQITVGLYQVQAKMEMTKRLKAPERARLMARHPASQWSVSIDVSRVIRKPRSDASTASYSAGRACEGTQLSG
jgi:hypothetical protein